MDKVDSVQILEIEQKSSKHNYAYNTLKNWIKEGVLSPGTIIVERKVCEVLGLSRTPVRSALQELAKEGFLETAPGRGMMVSKLQLEDVAEIYQLREVLDVLALELFMKNDNPAIVASMRETVNDLSAALEKEDYAAFVFADNKFHDLYTSYCGNERLKNIWMDLTEQYQRIAIKIADDKDMCEKTYNAHSAIMDQVEAGNIPKATALLRKHMRDARDYHIKKMMNLL